MCEIRSEQCTAGDIARVTLTLSRPASADTFDYNRHTGSFVLVDALTGATLAGGVITGICHEPAATHATGTYVLTRDRLERGLCSDVAPGSFEFLRRAEEAAILLRAAGVPVVLALEQNSN